MKKREPEDEQLCIAVHTINAVTLPLDFPLTTVFNKLGDTYQAYCNTYKTYAMATYHGGTGQPFNRDITLHGQDTNIPNDYRHDDMDNIDNTEQENHTNLAILMQDLDDLCQFRLVKVNPQRP